MSDTYAKARAAIDAALETAADASTVITAVVVDAGGHVVAAGRMDGAGYALFDLARRKASTSANFGAPLNALVDMMRQDAMIHEALATSEDILLLPGAAPLGNGCAIGVAGGHYSADQDIADKAAARVA